MPQTTATPEQTTAAVRAVEWGHWGLTFFWRAPGAYAPELIVGQLYFPVGTRGPCDRSGRDYQAVCRAWTVDGVLPAGVLADAAKHRYAVANRRLMAEYRADKAMRREMFADDDTTA